MTDNLSRYTAEGLRSVCKSLQMVLMGRFCNFSKSKTVNCHMQAWVGANRGNVINFESGYKKQIRVKYNIWDDLIIKVLL